MLVGRAGLSPIMVGRSAELDRLARLVGAGRVPHVALVGGEAGIGKTRLIQELVAQVPPSTVVLAGQADPGTVGRPLELLLDALASWPGGSTPPPTDRTGGINRADRADGLDEPERAERERLLDLVRDGARPADDRVRAAVDLVRQITAGRAGLVVFEDLHWADSESVRVFEQLAEPVTGSRLLLVGTYRPDGLSRRHPAAELLPRLERRHSITHLHLGRLTVADVGHFLGAADVGAPSYRVVEELHSRTGGNPFFLEELVASSTSSTNPGDRGDRALLDPDALPLPWTITELVVAKVDELDDEVRGIVKAAAVLGRRVSFDLLAAVTGSDEETLIRLLRTAVGQGLLVETETDVFGFRHEIFREAVQGELLGRERRRLHQAALDALRRAGSQDHVALASHARGAGRYDDMVAEARLGARQSLGLGSSYQALELAEMGLTEAEDDVELLAMAARAAWLCDLVDDACRHADRWLRLAQEADDVSEQAAALGMRIRAAFDVDDLDAMAGFTDALVEVIDRLPCDEERARAMSAVAQSHMLRGELAATCEWADKAQALAEAHGLADVRLAAMVEKGSILLHHPERLPEGRRLLEEAATEAERLDQPVLAARALNNLVWGSRLWSSAEDIPELVERGRKQAEAAGFDRLGDTSQVQTRALLAATIDGDLGAALAHLEENRRRDPTPATWWKRKWLTVLHAGLALEAGDVDTAEECTALAKPTTPRTAAGVVGLDLHIACRRGRLDEARTHLARLLEVIAADGYGIAAQAHDLVAVGLQAGLTPGELRPLAEQMGSYVGHRHDPDHPWRRLVDAQLAEAEGRVDEAAQLYAAAAATLGAAGEIHAGHRGTAHVGAARGLIALDRLDEARDHVVAAAEHLARWGGWRVAELRAVERRLGLGDEPSGPDALTPREREVCALLAEGLTNAQLAERLYISPRTAAVHVSNILTKLGMSSRTEVAAWAARQPDLTAGSLAGE